MAAQMIIIYLLKDTNMIFDSIIIKGNELDELQVHSKGLSKSVGGNQNLKDIIEYVFYCY